MVDFWGFAGASREELSLLRAIDLGPFTSLNSGEFAKSFKPSGVHWVLPPAIQHSLSGLSIAGTANLFNRAHLAGIFGLSLPANDVPDPGVDQALILLSYRKWGTLFARYLSGEFSCGIWDEQPKTLLLCRDHLGAIPLFYWQQDRKTAFSNTPLKILRLPGVPRSLNRRKLAGVCTPRGWEFHSEETVHEGIMSLPPGSVRKIDDRRSTQETYWSPGVNPALVPPRESDAFDRLRELLFLAVDNRIGGRRSVAARLSGGIDSSVVVSLAAASLQRSNRSLLAVSAVPAEKTGFADEREYIEEFRNFPNVAIAYVDAAGAGPFDMIDKPDEFEACFDTFARRYHLRALEDEAVGHGSDILLDGSYGEFSVTTAAKGYYAELAATFRWPRLWHELRRHREVAHSEGRNLNPARLLGSELLHTLMPHRAWAPPFLFLSREFQRESQAAVARVRYWPSHRTRDLEVLNVYLRRHATRPSTPGRRRLDLSCVLMDKDLVEFSLAAPGRMKFRDGYPRYLVRGALKGILPEKNRWRTNKGIFSGDYYSRFNAQLPKARRFVEAIGPSDPVRSIIDVDAVKAHLLPVDPVKGTFEAVVLPVNLYAIAFLRQFREFRH